MVTPSGESVLVDTGNPGGRDAASGGVAAGGSEVAADVRRLCHNQLGMGDQEPDGDAWQFSAASASLHHCGKMEVLWLSYSTAKRQRRKVRRAKADQFDETTVPWPTLVEFRDVVSGV